MAGSAWKEGQIGLHRATTSPGNRTKGASPLDSVDSRRDSYE